jgi:nucleotide-binding universal stress UspA family protein
VARPMLCRKGMTTSHEMHPQARILVASDLGPIGDDAMRLAQDRLRWTSAVSRIGFCHVLEDARANDTEAVAKGVREVFDHLGSELGGHVRDVDVLVRTGGSGDAIAECAATWSADLVVIGRPGHPAGAIGRVLTPGVVDQVVRRAPCAVLVSRPGPVTGRVLVGISDDQPMPVLQAALYEQRHRDAEVIVVQWIQPIVSVVAVPEAPIPLPIESQVLAAVEPIRSLCREVGLTAEIRVLPGDAGTGLCELATELDADMIVVGTHGRSGLSRVLFGSTAERVADDAPCSVMVVRLPDA